jgi:hypothetical protein
MNRPRNRERIFIGFPLGGIQNAPPTC